jgi:hypothetical protein
MDQDTIDAKVQQLVDRNEITDLVSRLGVSLDEGRFDELQSFLVEEATASTPGGAREGRDAVVGLARKNHRPEWRSEHVITNLLIDLDGDRAKVRANLVVNAATGGPSGPEAVDGSPDPEGASLPPLPPKVTYTLGEVYRFDVVRTPDGWRFSRVDATPTWYWGTRPRPA